MSQADLPNGQEIRTSLSSDGTLEVRLTDAPSSTLLEDEVRIKIEAAPLNPSDITRMFGLADLSTIASLKDGIGLSLTVPAEKMLAMKVRINQSYLVGNEGSGTVIEAGSNPAAQALLGKRVAVRDSGIFATYKVAKANLCMPMAAGITPAQSAATIINPLTALGMLGTTLRENHKALILTTAASNLGQMVNRLCQKDGVDLVCVVRSAAQQKILHDQGAKYVCNSSDADFQSDLITAISATGATIAFDAISGGTMANQLLFCMEQAALKNATSFSAYGTSTHKQLYLYGNLDPSPTILNRTYGLAWSMGGWLVDYYLESLTQQGRDALNARVLADLTTTFASHYARAISLEDVCNPEIAKQYAKRATGEKLLVAPNGPVEI